MGNDLKGGTIEYTTEVVNNKFAWNLEVGSCYTFKQYLKCGTIRVLIQGVFDREHPPFLYIGTGTTVIQNTKQKHIKLTEDSAQLIKTRARTHLFLKYEKTKVVIFDVDDVSKLVRLEFFHCTTRCFSKLDDSQVDQLITNGLNHIDRDFDIWDRYLTMLFPNEPLLSLQASLIEKDSHLCCLQIEHTEGIILSLLNMENPPEVYSPNDLKVGEKGSPFGVFPPGYVPNCTAYQSLLNGMGAEWTIDWYSFVDDMRVFAQSKIPIAKSLGLDKECSQCLDDVVEAIVLYSSDTRQFHGSFHLNPYFVLNKRLRAREDIDEFKPFLYYLVRGLTSLPPLVTTCYRGETSRVIVLSPQYVIGNHVIWITITSASTEISVGESFAKRNGGTLYIISATHARDISKLSKFPDEKEVVLTPNSIFKVTNVVLASGMVNYDTLYLQQLQ